jgi:hypothetical protein
METGGHERLSFFYINNVNISMSILFNTRTHRTWIPGRCPG